MACSATPATSIRKFHIDLDSEWLTGLWHRTMHRRWAVTRQAMFDILSDNELLLVAELDGIRNGFCAVDSQHEPTAALVVMLVDPAVQRRGIGTELMKRVDAMLRAKEPRSLDLGAGSRSYFWPGLPSEQEGAWLFFTRQGFQETESSEDLVRTLDDFETPAWVLARQIAAGTQLHLCDTERADEIDAFEHKYFPMWAQYFSGEMKQGGYENILFAEGPDHSIHGTILMKADGSLPWQNTRGKRIGTLNTLGVAPQQRGQGTGLALTARAMQHLRERGCSSCYIQWTGLADWYGKLGATRLAHYRMARRTVAGVRMQDS